MKDIKEYPVDQTVPRVEQLTDDVRVYERRRQQWHKQDYLEDLFPWEIVPPHYHGQGYPDDYTD